MRRSALSLTLLAAMAWPAGSSLAADFTVGAITVTDPWARATAPTAIAGAAYMTLTTDGETADRLIGGQTPVSDVVELHTHTMDDDGVMRMRPVDAIEVAPDTPAALAPGGLHIMLIRLNGPLVQGETFPLTLMFEDAGSVEVMVPIGAAGALAPPTPAPTH